MSENNERQYGLLHAFYIDTDGYSDRDRDMFTAGVEFQMYLSRLHDPAPYCGVIHRENESRLRMTAPKFSRKVTIEPCEEKYDPDGTWSYITIEAMSDAASNHKQKENFDNFH